MPRNGQQIKKEAVQRNTRVSTKVQVLIKDAKLGTKLISVLQPN